VRVSTGLLVVAVIALAACTVEDAAPAVVTDVQASTPAAPVDTAGPTYGTARIAPATVSRGESVTVTPTAEVERTCGPWGVLYSAVSDGLQELGQLTTTGDLTPMTDATFTPCHEYPSDNAMSFVVPAGLKPDDYVVCIWQLDDTAGCGTFTVL